MVRGMEPKPKFLAPHYARVFEDAAVAAVYRKRPPYPPEVAPFVASLLPDGNRHLLDLGAGTGEMAIPLAKLCVTVDAVEPSAAMLRIGQMQPGADAGNLSWFNESAEAFGYPRSYGLVVCAQCLGWMDWEQVFPRIRSALDAGGQLVLVSLDELSLPDWQPGLISAISRFSTNQDFEPFDLVAGLTARGLFEVAGSWQSPAHQLAQSVEDFVDSIHARNGFSRDRMAPDAAVEFDNVVRALLDPHHPDGVLRGEITARVTWGTPL